MYAEIDYPTEKGTSPTRGPPPPSEQALSLTQILTKLLQPNFKF